MEIDCVRSILKRRWHSEIGTERIVLLLPIQASRNPKNWIQFHPQLFWLYKPEDAYLRRLGERSTTPGGDQIRYGLRQDLKIASSLSLYLGNCCTVSPYSRDNDRFDPSIGATTGQRSCSLWILHSQPCSTVTDTLNPASKLTSRMTITHLSYWITAYYP